MVVGGFLGKKKDPSSFAFYQKEQLFPVLGHRWYCAEEREKQRKEYKAWIFSPAVECPKCTLLQPELK